MTVLDIPECKHCDIFRERQQQLDELSKELQRVQDESELLKMKLKSLSRASNSGASGASVSKAGPDLNRKSSKLHCF